MSETDAPADLRREFWTQVVIFNVAVLAFAVGVLLLGLTDRWQLGVVLLLTGTLFGLHGYRRYREVAGRNG